MRKDDIQFRNGRATVNIKVPYRTLAQSVAEARTWGENMPDGLTAEWIEANVTDDALDVLFWMTCENEYEYFADYAAEIMPGTTFYVDGRSGGWAVSNWDEDDVDGWDAIALAKWAKIERVAREIAQGVNAQVVLSISINEYAPDNLYVDAAPIGEEIAAQ